MQELTTNFIGICHLCVYFVKLMTKFAKNKIKVLYSNSDKCFLNCVNFNSYFFKNQQIGLHFAFYFFEEFKICRNDQNAQFKKNNMAFGSRDRRSKMATRSHDFQSKIAAWSFDLKNCYKPLFFWHVLHCRLTKMANGSHDLLFNMATGSFVLKTCHKPLFSLI